MNLAEDWYMCILIFYIKGLKSGKSTIDSQFFIHLIEGNQRFAVETCDALVAKFQDTSTSLRSFQYVGVVALVKMCIVEMKKIAPNSELRKKTNTLFKTTYDVFHDEAMRLMADSASKRSETSAVLALLSTLCTIDVVQSGVKDFEEKHEKIRSLLVEGGNKALAAVSHGDGGDDESEKVSAPGSKKVKVSKMGMQALKRLRQPISATKVENDKKSKKKNRNKKRKNKRQRLASEASAKAEK